MADTETHQAIGVGVGGSTKQFRNLKAVFPLVSWAQKNVQRSYITVGCKLEFPKTYIWAHSLHLIENLKFSVDVFRGTGQSEEREGEGELCETY